MQAERLGCIRVCWQSPACALVISAGISVLPAAQSVFLCGMFLRLQSSFAKKKLSATPATARTTEREATAVLMPTRDSPPTTTPSFPMPCFSSRTTLLPCTCNARAATLRPALLAAAARSAQAALRPQEHSIDQMPSLSSQLLPSSFATSLTDARDGCPPARCRHLLLFWRQRPHSHSFPERWAASPAHPPHVAIHSLLASAGTCPAAA